MDEAHVNELALQVLPLEQAEGFLNLPYRDKLVGLAVFAHIGGDEEVREAALATLRALDEMPQQRCWCLMAAYDNQTIEAAYIGNACEACGARLTPEEQAEARDPQYYTNCEACSTSRF